MFGDPCPGTHKYLEAHYQCVSAAQTSTTTNRPSPPWLITSQPSVWSTSTVRVPTTTRIYDNGIGGSSINATHVASLPKSNVDTNPSEQDVIHSQQSTVIPSKSNVPSASPSSSSTLASLLPLSSSTTKPIQSEIELNGGGVTLNVFTSSLPTVSSSLFNKNQTIGLIDTKLTATLTSTSDVGTGSLDEEISGGGADRENHNNLGSAQNDVTNTMFSTQASVLLNSNNDNYFCGSRNARNLFWNVTRVGEVNVQPCPGKQKNSHT